MSTRITLAVAATFALGTAASAATIDFNDNLDEVITEVTSSDGAISASLEVVGGTAQAVVFNTNGRNPNDRDLLDPFRNEDGSITDFRPGGVLIIQQDGPNEDGVLVPNDNADGGSITFNFDQAINFSGFRVFDDATITVSTSGRTETFAGTVNIPDPTNENAGNRFFGDFNITSGIFDNVTDLTFTFDGSGAIDDLQVAAVPLPAGILLLGGGLAAFGGFGSWRKRKQA